jgi:hypothetical protein
MDKMKPLRLVAGINIVLSLQACVTGWTQTGSLATPRAHHAMSDLYVGTAAARMELVTGGLTSTGGAVSAIEAYDPVRVLGAQ